MNNTSNRNHASLLILAFLVLLVSAAAYAYLCYAVAVSTAQISSARNSLALEKADKDHGQDLMTEYQQTITDRAKLRKLFIPSSDAVAFIEAVESIGDQSGGSVSLSSISADAMDKVAPGSLGSLRAKVEAHGTWVSVMKALILAETLPYDVSVDNVRLDFSAGSNVRGNTSPWSLSYDIRAALVASFPASL